MIILAFLLGFGFAAIVGIIMHRRQRRQLMD
ncbi:hypothetical protein N752_11100 [Desulforamulus aquiferis]|nr:hypothetical protein N752_11100 [Desulforamulus aquiferis]